MKTQFKDLANFKAKISDFFVYLITLNYIEFSSYSGNCFKYVHMLAKDLQT